MNLEKPLAACIGILALAVYALTLYPTVAGGDSGELAAVARTLGVAHPPGYPLYTLLGKLFTFIPHGTVAWRVNLLSAVCDAAAASVLLLAIARWTGSAWAGFFGAGLFAFSPLTWTYAVTAEVFALNNLCLAGLLYLAVAYARTGERRFARAGALVFGLGMANHHTLLFFGAPIAAWVLWTGRRELLTARNLAALGACFAAGLLPYLYLPLASSRVPAVAWGDQTTWDGFLTHVLRREYGTFRLGNAAGSEEFKEQHLLLAHLSHFLARLPREALYLGAPLAALGIGVAVRKGRGLTLERVALGALVFYVLVFCLLSNIKLDDPLSVRVESRFWQQAELLLCVFAAFGFAAAAEAAARRIGRRHELLAGAALALVAAQLAVNFHVQDQSGNWLFRDFIEAILKPLPPGSLLLTSGDYISGPARYFQVVEGLRPDVRVMDHNYMNYPWHPRFARVHAPDIVLPKGGTYRARDFHLNDLLTANAGRPLFVVNGMPAWDRTTERDYRLWAFGFSELILPKEQAVAWNDWTRVNGTDFTRFDGRRLDRYPRDSWEHLVQEAYWNARYKYGSGLIAFGSQHANDRPSFELAAATLDDLNRQLTYPKAPVLKYLGIVNYYLSRTDGRYAEPMARAWEKYLPLAPASDPELGMIREIMASYAKSRPGG